MILYKTDMRCLQAYKHRVLEGHSHRTPSMSVLNSVLIVEEKVTIKGHDSHHNTISRLATFAKVTYQSDRNKGKDNTYNSFES